MDAVREQINKAIKVLLDGIPGYVTARNPDNEFEPPDLPGLALIDGGQVVTARASGSTEYVGRSSVVLYVERGADEGAQLVAAYADVVSALIADITLGGLVAWIREVELSEPIVVDEVMPGVKLDKTFLAASLELEFDFATAEDDPTVKMPYQGP